MPTGQYTRGATLLERFISHTERLPSGCLGCNYHTTADGYPQMQVEGRWHPISHVAWFLHFGEWPPPGMEMHHRCHNPETCKLGAKCPHRRCAEWSHLEILTPQEHGGLGNAGEWFAARQHAKTHCPRGHEYTPDNTINGTNRNGKPNRTCRECGRIRCREYYRKNAGQAKAVSGSGASDLPSTSLTRSAPIT